jgi:ribose transport system permease protein
METMEHPVKRAAAPPPVGELSRAASGTGLRLLHWAEAYALLILLVVIAIFFSVWSKTSDTFFTTANLQTVIGNQAVVAIIALGALIPLVCQEWDLSVGAIAGLAAVAAASLMSGGGSVLAAIALSIAIGAGIGALNGTIVTRARVHAVIATLGMSVILAGVIDQKTGGTAVVSNIPQGLTNFGSDNWLGIPRTAYVLLLMAVLVYYLLQHTPFGRYLYALGTNPGAAKLVGLRPKLLLFGAFLLAGLLSGIGGILQVARSGGADPRLGDSFTLPALAAAFLSAASVTPGRYNVGGVLIAVFFLATLNSGLNLAGAQPYVSSYVNGAALIIGVAMAAYLGRKRSGETD